MFIFWVFSLTFSNFMCFYHFLIDLNWVCLKRKTSSMNLVYSQWGVTWLYRGIVRLEMAQRSHGMALILVPFIKGIGCLYLDLFRPVTESGEACSILHFNTSIHADLISQELERTRGWLFQSHAQPWDDFLGPLQTPSLPLIRSGRAITLQSDEHRHWDRGACLCWGVWELTRL